MIGLETLSLQTPTATPTPNPINSHVSEQGEVEKITQICVMCQCELKHEILLFTKKNLDQQIAGEKKNEDIVTFYI